MTSHGEMPLAQAMMAAAAPMLIQRAVVSGDAEHGLMATGVVAGRLKDLPSCADLLSQIETQARARLEALTQQPFVSSEVETPVSGISTSLDANGG